MTLSPLDIIKSSSQLYAKNWHKLLIYVILLFVPSFAITIISSIGLALMTLMPAADGINSIIILLVFAASIVFIIWLTISLTRVIWAALGDEPIPPCKAMLGQTSHLIWPLLYTSILVFLAAFGLPLALILWGLFTDFVLVLLVGLFLILIPGIIIAMWYTFTNYEVILAGRKGVSAMRESKKMVAGRWWGIFFRLIIPIIFFSVIGSFLSYLLTLPFAAKQDSLTLFGLTDLFITSLISTLFVPFTIASGVVLYKYAREVKN